MHGRGPFVRSSESPRCSRTYNHRSVPAPYLRAARLGWPLMTNPAADRFLSRWRSRCCAPVLPAAGAAWPGLDLAHASDAPGSSGRRAPVTREPSAASQRSGTRGWRTVSSCRAYRGGRPRPRAARFPDGLELPRGATPAGRVRRLAVHDCRNGRHRFPSPVNSTHEESRRFGGARPDRWSPRRTRSSR